MRAAVRPLWSLRRYVEGEFFWLLRKGRYAAHIRQYDTRNLISGKCGILSPAMAQLWDVVVVGTGIAGLSAAMYSGRFNLKTLVIGELPGGIITTTHLVENYPGIPSITGIDMGTVFLEHAKKFGAEIKFGRVADVSKNVSEDKTWTKPVYKVKTAREEFLAKTVIFATGTEHRKLGVPGEERLNAKGVSYCALCDAAFFKGKNVAIVGGGDSSSIEALILAEQVGRVYHIVRRDVLRAEPINLEKEKNHPRIELRLKTEIAEIRGEQKVESILLKSGEELKVEGVFVAIGHIPLSGIAEKLGVEVDLHKQIKINRNAQTNLPGVYACGDVVDTAFKQAITGAAEAVIASYFAYTYIGN